MNANVIRILQVRRAVVAAGVAHLLAGLVAGIHLSPALSEKERMSKVAEGWPCLGLELRGRDRTLVAPASPTSLLGEAGDVQGRPGAGLGLPHEPHDAPLGLGAVGHERG